MQASIDDKLAKLHEDGSERGPRDGINVMTEEIWLFLWSDAVILAVFCVTDCAVLKFFSFCLPPLLARLAEGSQVQWRTLR